MIDGLERDRLARGADYFVQNPLVALRDLDVFDSSADDAHNMMVVTSQPVCDLITGHSPAPVVRRDHTSPLQNSKCAIERRQRQAREKPVEVGCGLGTVAGEEGFDNSTPSPRVADVVLTES